MSSILFLLSILLVRMPPFYVIPLIKSSLLTSHSLARILVLFLLGMNIWKKDFLRLKSAQKNLFYLYLGYLFFHSLSIINAVNIDAFLLRYKDVVFPGLFLLASLTYMRSKTGFVKVLLISLVINFVYQAILYLFPNLASLIGRSLLYDGHREFVSFNLSRGRIFIETYDEIVFPFIFVLGSSYEKILSLIIIVPSLLSNFRSRLLMLIVSVGMTFLTWFRSWKRVVLFGLVGVVLVLGADTLSLRLWGFSLVDRVLLRSQYDDIQSLDSRWVGITQSFDLGNQYPLTGVGLGNYFDHLPTTTRDSVFSIVNYYGTVWVSSLNPHNIFAQIVAETGMSGLIFYLMMLIFFVKIDWSVMHRSKPDKFNQAAVIAFWSLLSYSLFNPSTTLTYNTLFWVLRSLVIYEDTR